MGAGVTRVASYEADMGPATPGPALGLDPSDWQRAVPRVAAYLRAMGVTVPWEVERLCERVRTRVESRAATVPLEDPLEAAIEETDALLDRWLAAEVGVVGDNTALYVARAAVLGGAVPGWSSAWAGISEGSVAAAIRNAMVSPVPEPAPLPMEPSTIDLFGQRVGRGIRRLLRWVFPAARAARRVSGGQS